MSPTGGVRSLNEEFYASSPSAYFRDRLTFLALRAARPDAISEATGNGFLWGQVWISTEEAPTASQNDQDRDAQTSFVATESQVLLHHAAEALIRMFLAHEGEPDCPWLQIAALTEHRVYWEEVAELAQPSWDDDRVASVAEVFLGGVPTDPSAEWMEHRDTAVRLLRRLARRLVDEGKLYNAAKHGLTMIGGASSLHFIPVAPGESTFDPSAPSIEAISKHGVQGANGINAVYLERDGKPKTGYTWYHVTRWYSPQEAAVLTHMTLILMDALWSVARVRYLEGEKPSQMRWVSREAVDALGRFERGGPVQEARRSVATQPPSPPRSRITKSEED